MLRRLFRKWKFVVLKIHHYFDFISTSNFTFKNTTKQFLTLHRIRILYANLFPPIPLFVFLLVYSSCFFHNFPNYCFFLEFLQVQIAPADKLQDSPPQVLKNRFSLAFLITASILVLELVHSLIGSRIFFIISDIDNIILSHSNK